MYIISTDFHLTSTRHLALFLFFSGCFQFFPADGTNIVLSEMNSMDHNTTTDSKPETEPKESYHDTHFSFRP
jgi:hypothetical protein